MPENDAAALIDGPATKEEKETVDAIVSAIEAISEAAKPVGLKRDEPLVVYPFGHNPFRSIMATPAMDGFEVGKPLLSPEFMAELKASAKAAKTSRQRFREFLATVATVLGGLAKGAAA